MTVDEVESAFGSAGFEDVDISLEQLELDWPTATHAVRGIFGTPYGPVVAALDGDVRRAVLEDLEARMTGPDGRAKSHVMVAVLAKGRDPVDKS